MLQLISQAQKIISLKNFYHNAMYQCYPIQKSKHRILYQISTLQKP